MLKQLQHPFPVLHIQTQPKQSQNILKTSVFQNLQINERPVFQPWFLEQTEIISIVPDFGWTLPISTKLTLVWMATAASSSPSSSSPSSFSSSSSSSPSSSSSVGLSSSLCCWTHVLLLRTRKRYDLACHNRVHIIWSSMFEHSRSQTTLNHLYAQVSVCTRSNAHSSRTSGFRKQKGS